MDAVVSQTPTTVAYGIRRFRLLKASTSIDPPLICQPEPLILRTLSRCFRYVILTLLYMSPIDSRGSN